MTEIIYKDYNFDWDIGTMTPFQYISMINILESVNPKRICELGSGESTKIFKTYCKNKDCELYSIEHDSYYTPNGGIMMPLSENTNLSVNGKLYEGCSKYEGFENWLMGQDKFDFILIDGPNDGLPTNDLNLKYARIQIIDFVLFDKLRSGSIIMYHDSERGIAQNTLNEFERLLIEKKHEYEKNVILEKDINVIEYNKRILGSCPELMVYTIK